MQKEILTSVFHCCVVSAILMLIPTLENYQLDSCIRIGLLAINSMFLGQKIHTAIGQRDKNTYWKVFSSSLVGTMAWLLLTFLPMLIAIILAWHLIVIFAIILTSSLISENHNLLIRIGKTCSDFLQTLDILK